MNKVYIIAEAGVNHNGSLELAKKLIDVAVEAKADAVKFQTFVAQEVISEVAPKADYQKHVTAASESMLDMVRKFELDEHAHQELMRYCASKKIAFLSTPFDFPSVDLLHRLGLTTFKIPSGEITNIPYLRKIGALKKKIILSTGMADMGEIKNALEILENAGTPRTRITVLHCNTAYPTPVEDVNLKAMLVIKEKFKVEVGYSDHTPGIEVPIAAVALGASVIEKHFTLDKSLPGPDHQASLSPDELKLMVTSIRNIEKALGDGVKKPSTSELKNKAIARKSLIARKKISKDHIITSDDIAIKRPGTGIAPQDMEKVIGLKTTCDIERDSVIEWHQLKAK